MRAQTSGYLCAYHPATQSTMLHIIPAEVTVGFEMMKSALKKKRACKQQNSKRLEVFVLSF